MILAGALVVAAQVPAAMALALGGFASSLEALYSESAQGDERRVVVFLGLALVLGLLASFAQVIANYARRRLHDELHLDLSTRLFDHAGSLDLGRFEQPDFHDRLSTAQQIPARQTLRFLASVCDTLRFGLGTLVLIAMMVVIEPVWTPVIAVAAVPFLIQRWRLARERAEITRGFAQRLRWSDYYFSLVSDPELVDSTRTLGLGPLLRSRFRAILTELKEALRRNYLRQAIGRSAGSLTFLVVLGVILLMVLQRARGGGLEAGPLVAYGLAAFRLRSEADGLSMSSADLAETSALIGFVPEVLSVEAAIPVEAEASGRAFAGGIELERVSFTYPGTERPALREVSLRIEPGQTVALVGHNGSGKTTLARLIARLYDPTAGRVLVDGEDLRAIPLADWYQHLGWVPERAPRFEATLRENVAFGAWRRLLDDPDRVAELIARARLEGLADSLPAGLDTALGREFGEVTLSNGQWQRLSVARVLAREPTVLILDEPTANLDVFAELELFEGIRELAPGATTILISHRFSTVRAADRIFVLEDGLLVESGDHEELQRRGGVYASLYRVHGAATPEAPSAEGAQLGGPRAGSKRS